MRDEHADDGLLGLTVRIHRRAEQIGGDDLPHPFLCPFEADLHLCLVHDGSLLRPGTHLLVTIED
ncbi:hypothetical protein D3C86_1835900 [compost metagenome]